MKDSQKDATQAELQLLKSQFAFILPVRFTSAKSMTNTDWKKALLAELGRGAAPARVLGAEHFCTQTGLETALGKSV